MSVDDEGEVVILILTGQSIEAEGMVVTPLSLATAEIFVASMERLLFFGRNLQEQVASMSREQIEAYLNQIQEQLRAPFN